MSHRPVKTAIQVALVGLALVVTSVNAEASLVLRLTSGAQTVEVDAGQGDSVLFIGAVGGFFINLTSGISGPAELVLTSANVSGGAGELIIELTDTGYAATGPGSLVWDWIGSLSGGSVSGQAWKDPDNQEFGQGSITSGALGPFGPGVILSSGSVSHGTLPDPYSMSIRLTFSATDALQVYSGSFIIRNVPEPAELLLFGLGLTGVGLVARRRRRT